MADDMREAIQGVVLNLLQGVVPGLSVARPLVEHALGAAGGGADSGLAREASRISKRIHRSMSAFAEAAPTEAKAARVRAASLDFVTVVSTASLQFSDLLACDLRPERVSAILKRVEFDRYAPPERRKFVGDMCDQFAAELLVAIGSSPAFQMMIAREVLVRLTRIESTVATGR